MTSAVITTRCSQRSVCDPGWTGRTTRDSGCWVRRFRYHCARWLTILHSHRCAAIHNNDYSISKNHQQHTEDAM